jgi:putative restriction endonuclease
VIGCVVLSSPFFFRDDEFVPVPSDFQPSTQVRKTYDLGGGEGLLLWKRVQERLRVPSATGVSPLAAAGLAYGDPRLVRPRLGQGGFRTVVLDAYGRRCTVTGERTLPALEAAHIQPYAVVQQHEVTNGLALRSDIHRLFDQGYVTVDPSLHFRVSRAIREEFENGRDYYALHGQEIRLPAESDNRPHLTALDWHLSTVYLGD